MQRNLDIQALRAAAVTMVFLQHARMRIPTSEAYGWLFKAGTFWGGVDVFLAISGFVICGSACARMGPTWSKGLSSGGLVEFWKRRAWRLFPAAWFWLAASIALTPFLRGLHSADPLLAAKAAAYAMLGIANGFWWQCVQGSGVGQWCPNPDINGVFWSLSLELQLYLLVSLALWAGSMRLLVALAFVICLAWPFSGVNFTFAWSFRPQAFCLGILAYALVTRFPRSAAGIPLTIRQIGIVACLAGVYVAPVSMPSANLLILALASGACVFLASPDGAIGKGALAHAASWVGDRSYSIYLCHLPVLLAFGELSRRTAFDQHPSWSIHALYLSMAAASTLLLSHLSFRYLEGPATAWGRRT